MKTSYILFLLSLLPSFSIAQRLNYALTGSYTNNDVFYTTLQPNKVAQSFNFMVNLKSGFSAGVLLKYRLDRLLDVSFGGEVFTRRITAKIGSPGMGGFPEKTGDFIEYKVPLRIIYKQVLLDDKTLFWNNSGGLALTYLSPFKLQQAYYSHGNYGSLSTTLEQSGQFGIELLLGTSVYKQFSKFGGISMGLTYHYKTGKDYTHISYYKVNSENFVLSSDFRASFFSIDLAFYLRKNKLKESEIYDFRVNP